MIKTPLRTIPRWLRMAFILAVLQGCGGGNGSGTPTGSAATAATSTAAGVRCGIFRHSGERLYAQLCDFRLSPGSQRAQGLRLDEANSFALLVDVDSNQVGGVKRVAPAIRTIAT